MKIRAGFVSNSSSSSFIVASKHHNVSEAKRISEFEEVYEEIDYSHRNYVKPVSFCLTLHNTKQKKIYKSAREGHTDCNAQKMHNHEGKTCQNAVNSVV